MLDVVTTWQEIFKLMTSFGDVSGYKINWTKSEIMPLGASVLQTIFSEW